MHLSGQAYPLALRKLLYEGIQQTFCLIDYKVYVLDPFVLIPGRDKAVIFDGLALKNSIGLRVIGHPAYGCGSQIYTVNDHFK